MWGKNYDGEIGNGMGDWGRTEKSPVKIQNISDIVSVSTAWKKTLAVLSDGSLWGWGATYTLGIETTETNFYTPVKIMDDVKKVQASTLGTMVLKNDNSLWYCGGNSNGELQFAKYPDSFNTRIYIKVMNQVVDFSMYRGCMAVKTDGTLWAWGDNMFGQLGNGTKENIDAPIKIMDNVKSVSMNTHTLAVKTDGTLWAWGANDYGQLGTGDYKDRLKPVKVMDQVKDTSTGTGYSMIIKNDNSLWTVGQKQIGTPDGSENNYVPVKLMDNVKCVSTGYHVGVIKNDGSIWCWGSNGTGEVGNGQSSTNTPVSEPTQVHIDSNTLN